MTPTHRSDPSGPAIAIVGAGLAGLSCAAALQAAGRGVVLFEKSRGPAGRMSTRNGDDWQCDFGAQYFVVRDPSFRDEVQRWTDAGVAQLWQPRLSSFDGRAWKPTRTALARHVGVPAMTAPAHWLARGLEVRSQATVQPLVWTVGDGSCSLPNRAFPMQCLVRCCWPCLHRRRRPCSASMRPGLVSLQGARECRPAGR